MFKKFTNGCVKLVQRFLPDAFVFCIILTIVVFIAAMPVAGMNPIEVANAWGSGVWGLLAFSMQMALVLVLGSALANAPAIKRIIVKLAGVPKKPAGAVAFVTIISAICCFINWGFGLIIGALLAKEVAKKIKGLDYRLIIAAAYSGFVIWHSGISGSIPLGMTALDVDGTVANTGGAVTEVVPTSQTIFSAWNLIMVVAVVVVVAIVNAKMHPDAKDVVSIDPKLLEDAPEAVETKAKKDRTPAEKLENSMILSYIVVVIGAVYLIYYFVNAGSILNALSLNIVNLIFLILGIAFHKTPIGYVKAIMESAESAGGIILQFPFYAGIQGMMVTAGSNGVSLASAISNGFVSISTPRTFPVLCYLAAGIVNFFVPSGGGQWAVQGPIMMPAGLKLGVTPAVTAMGIAWGDAWTNMLQPFWALPALGIAGLGARDIMGYCAIVLIVSGIVTALGFLFLVPLLA
ncbi:short-chain fatty acid transporter [Eubacterium ramulus]|jgi:short-chain fatty acids transporter|uniref:Short-chain fatty acid transporter n=1 Tax=Eubacterium ramulus TaxID=39490 RepID=A0A2V1JUT6_EUBRA|nr:MULTISPECIES: short-chain fatty acid transporter [Clostridia]MBS5189950.1 short-chain fatty acid transporter [Lachnospiraceae bacterium]PWE86238.1 short-chain fatty acid transporter [Eubacterium ramulus]RHV67795.1 short-chain fatty acid transporter [Roseburia sp. OM02-15]